MKQTLVLKFPSPYGVSFILIYYFLKKGQFVPERFRLLTEYRSFLFVNVKVMYITSAKTSFRLLTEYRSFL